LTRLQHFSGIRKQGLTNLIRRRKIGDFFNRLIRMYPFSVVNTSPVSQQNREDSHCGTLGHRSTKPLNWIIGPLALTNLGDLLKKGSGFKRTHILPAFLGKLPRLTFNLSGYIPRLGK